MSTGYLLGVDIGTYESKGVLTTLDGKVVNTQVRPHLLSIPKQGWAEHDAEKDWWGDFCSITKSLISQSGVNPREILAVGCSAIGPDMLPVDAACQPLRPAVLYGIDTRAAHEIAFLEKQLGKDAVFLKCGNALSAQSVGPKILWLKHNEPEIYNKTHKFITGTTFLVARLTGEYVIDHYSAAGFVPLYDIQNQCWNTKWCEGIVEPSRLPDLKWTTDIAGKVTDEAAKETGLAQGTPVIAGTIDAAAEAVSVGVVSPGQMMLMYGSTVFMIEVVNEQKSDERVWAAPYLFPNTYSLMAGMATSGSLTRWFRDNFATDFLQAEAATGKNAYAALVEEAAAVSPGSDGLILLPYFSGERTPINDPMARGVIFGLTLAHKRAHIFRAVLEGIGYGIAQHFDVLESMTAEPQEVAAVGGGTKNKLWLQIVSDVCGKQQLVPAITFGASYGDAFLAGLGINKFSSYKDISLWLRDIKAVKPDMERFQKYQSYKELYLSLYRQTKDLMHAVQRLV